MKKLNLSEAVNIVGGAVIKSCVVSFESATVDGATVCQKVSTCNGKYGETVIRATTDDANCA